MLSGYDQPGLFLQVIEGTAASLPIAVAAGLAAGSVTGALLELFDFAWVDDL
jgi:microcompartment protein CcmL/EutN